MEKTLMRPKIHFACLFGVDYELDIAPYWIRHWQSHQLDYYRIFLHREKSGIPSSTVKLFQDAGFYVSCVDGPHSNGILRRETVGRYAMNIDPEDFIVTADADEFHDLDYHDALQEYDIISGFLHDHYGASLEVCDRDPFEQYPHEEKFTGEPLKNFTPPFLRTTEWPLTRRGKILACRAGDKLLYMGSHVMGEVSSTAKILDNQKVHHFAWRESAARKTAVKSYYKKENLKEIFGVVANNPSIREECFAMHSDLVKRDVALEIV